MSSMFLKAFTPSSREAAAVADLIPISEPWIDDAERDALAAVAASGYISEHNVTRQFEAELCWLTGAKHAVAVTSGTAALYCAFKALGVGLGDEIIVPDLTCIATAD